MSLRRVVQAGLTLLFCAAPLLAQDFRVSTRLFDEKAPPEQGPPQPIARTWTIFHAGKVYDHVDILNETIILEPAQERFLILNTDRDLLTELSFREIQQYVFQARQRAQQKLSENPNLPNGAAVAFQLKPTFRTSFDERKKTLQMTSPIFRYDVTCAAADKELTAVYLRYAQRTAELNYILNPQLLPTVRQALNSELEQKKLLPTEIRLQSGIGSGLKLRAEHTYLWSLTNEDRRKVSDWEARLQNPRLKRLPFDQFQKELASN